MLLCLLMIGRMLLGHPETDALPQNQEQTAPEQEATEMQLDENALCELIGQALPVPVQQITATIGADRTVSVVLLVEKQALQQSGLVPEGLRTVMLFLPDTCRVYGAWQAGAADGALTLQCRQAELCGVEIPAEVAASLTEQIAAAINAYLTECGASADQITWTDGALTLGT